MRRSDWLLPAGRIFMGLIFALAGFSKLTEPYENFRGAIAHYEVIPYIFVPAIALILPWLEFFGGVFLVLGYMPRISSLMLSFFSFCFVFVLLASRAIFESSGKDCGCFGANGPIHFTVQQIFMVDVLNLFLGLKLFQTKTHPLSLDQILRA